MSVFEYRDYKQFLNDFIATFPKKGRGQARRLAEHLGVNSVVISQVLSGDRDFTAEQGLQLSRYFGFDSPTTEYLLTLIHQARAGTRELAQYYEQTLENMRNVSQELKSRIVKPKELSEDDKGVFYSNWYYVAICNLVALPGYDNVSSIAEYFGISRAKTADIIAFLVSRGLCTQDADGKLAVGVTTSYLPPTSPLARSHRTNWRFKAIERFTEQGPNDMFFTGPFSLSLEDMHAIRKELAELIGRVSKRVSDSPSEKLACLNIDWYEY